ncbi:VPS4-associated protein 1 [Pyronema omphalodes]|nr:VPS4-associated protein 1 [Pyronema omphalodes]
MSLKLPQNNYTHRIISDPSQARKCWVCDMVPSYRLVTSVLITDDDVNHHRDFFYTCPSHLQDPQFCTPIGPSAEELKKAAEERLKKELEEEVKREYEEKMRRKKEKEKEKEGDKKDGDKKDGDKKEGDKKDGDKKEEKKEEKNQTTTMMTTGRFRLSSFYDTRMNRIRQQEMKKRNQEILRNPMAFPSVPTRNPGE